MFGSSDELSIAKCLIQIIKRSVAVVLPWTYIYIYIGPWVLPSAACTGRLQSVLIYVYGSFQLHFFLVLFEQSNKRAVLSTRVLVI